MIKTHIVNPSGATPAQLAAARLLYATATMERAEQVLDVMGDLVVNADAEFARLAADRAGRSEIGQAADVLGEAVMEHRRAVRRLVRAVRHRDACQRAVARAAGGQRRAAA